MIADETPISNVSLATKISFGHLFQIILFNDSLLFCVYPCKHLLSKSSSLKLRKIGFIMSLTTLGSPGFSLYRAVPFILSDWYLHQLSGVLGHIWWRLSNVSAFEQW